MKKASIIAVLFMSVAMATAEEPVRQKVLSGEGLIGTYYNGDEFERPETGMIDLLTTIDCEWGDNRGSDWSAIWTGFIEAPVTGKVGFVAEV
ncbi:MAG: PA14 domain-containing protein, partial [Planctomycetota bacterium]